MKDMQLGPAPDYSDVLGQRALGQYEPVPVYIVQVSVAQAPSRIRSSVDGR